MRNCKGGSAPLLVDWCDTHEQPEKDCTIARLTAALKESEERSAYHALKLREAEARLALAQAVVRAVRAYVYKDVNTWRSGVHGDTPVPALGEALEAYDAEKP
jgi:hypothetical protein